MPYRMRIAVRRDGEYYPQPIGVAMNCLEQKGTSPICVAIIGVRL
jgi:hypothetical protein